MTDFDATQRCKHGRQFCVSCHYDEPKARMEERNRANPPQTQAATDVLVERQRQITDEGWTPEHDDESHDSGELAAAACAYALFAADELHPQSQGDGDYGREIPKMWPFHVSWYKPDDPRRALVKAAALILAEIERIDRGAS